MDDEKDLRAEDIFASAVPSEYVPVKLSSVGKLGLPETVHVRDYSFEDSMIFARATDANENQIVLNILKNVVYEDIDLTKVTLQDALEILMTIMANFYQNSIDMPYYIDENLKGEARETKENISTAHLRISDIPTLPLSEEVKLPISIEDKRFSVKFDYPRLYHDVAAKKYIEESFAKRDNEMSIIAQKIQKGIASYEEQKKMDAYNEEKGAEYLRVLNALQILEFNGEKVETLDAKIKALKKIPLPVVILLSNIIKVKFNFGLQSEVTFNNEITGEELTRHFSFRFSSFLSTIQSEDSSRYRVSFG